MSDGDRTRNELAVYIISVAAELGGVHPQTLRIYERKGLLSPARTRGNTRRYSDRDIERLRSIQRLTAAGVNLAGVKRILQLEADLERIEQERDRLARALEQADVRAREDQRRSADLVPLRSVAVLRWREGER
ncbi:MAG TPA: helix-turn-helix transcriptional regulator [Actinomycetota bacterium]